MWLSKFVKVTDHEKWGLRHEAMRTELKLWVSWWHRESWEVWDIVDSIICASGCAMCVRHYFCWHKKWDLCCWHERVMCIVLLRNCIATTTQLLRNNLTIQCTAFFSSAACIMVRLNYILCFECVLMITSCGFIRYKVWAAFLIHPCKELQA